MSYVQSPGVATRVVTCDLGKRFSHQVRLAKGSQTGSPKLTGQLRGGESGAGPLGAGAVEAYPAA